MRIKIFIIIIFTAHAQSLFSQSGWVQQTSGVSDILRSVFFVNSNTGWACGDNGKIVKTTNGGTIWIQQTSGTDQNFYSMFFLNENTGWICGGKNYPASQTAYIDCILKTTNGGSSWVTLYNQASAYPIVFTDIHFTNANSGIVIGAPGFSMISIGVIMKTSNGGMNWVSAGVDSLSRYSLAFANSSTGYLGCCYYIDYADVFTYISYVYKTTNYGTNWTMVYSADQKSITTLSCADMNNVLGGGMTLTSAGVIHKTQNGGGNWTQVLPQASGQILSVFSPSVNYSWAATYDKKILISSNGGSNWAAQQNPVNIILNDLYFVDTLTGWAVGNSGTILKTTNGGITGLISSSNEIPQEFSLFQNYPNPFNPATKIKFSVPLLRGVSGGRGVLVSLTVYDALGREIAVLVNEHLSPGTYEAQWDASSFPSGVYFYKLSAGDYAETKKMILIK